MLSSKVFLTFFIAALLFTTETRASEKAAPVYADAVLSDQPVAHCQRSQ
jgi:hypothetical protein